MPLDCLVTYTTVSIGNACTLVCKLSQHDTVGYYRQCVAVLYCLHLPLQPLLELVLAWRHSGVSALCHVCKAEIVHHEDHSSTAMKSLASRH
eukprot:12879-Heterococcus_DN1.PRE.1